MTYLRRTLLYLPAILWYGLIFFLSSQPKLPGPSDALWEFIWFKTAHAIFYAILTSLVWLATERNFSISEKNRRWYLFVTFLVVLVLALLDEFHQGFVPGRHMRTRDVVVDMTASAAALLAFSRYNRRQT